MPHDKNGNLIEVGAKVRVDFIVKQVYQTEGDGFCNATLESVEPMFPTQNKTTLTVNARQTELVDSPADAATTP